MAYRKRPAKACMFCCRTAERSVPAAERDQLEKTMGSTILLTLECTSLKLRWICSDFDEVCRGCFGINHQRFVGRASLNIISKNSPGRSSSHTIVCTAGRSNLLLRALVAWADDDEANCSGGEYRGSSEGRYATKWVSVLRADTCVLGSGLRTFGDRLLDFDIRGSFLSLCATAQCCPFKRPHSTSSTRNTLPALSLAARTIALS